MPTITSTDGTRLYYEEAGAGTPVVFVHEFAGDYRTWEPQLRALRALHRCVTFSARGYPPSEVPSDPARYGQDIVRARRDRGHGCARHRQGACGRPFHGRLYRAPCRHPSSAALHLGDGGRLRLGLGGRSRRARSDARECGGKRQDVYRKEHGRGGGDLCGRSDAQAQKIQGPARLCRIRRACCPNIRRSATR